ncbi:MAG TPA: type II secretion system secretin GspD [Casimicrobiaceae bacterium]
MRPSTLRNATALAVALTLAACAQQPARTTPSAASAASGPGATSGAMAGAGATPSSVAGTKARAGATGASATGTTAGEEAETQIFHGTGVVVRGQSPGGGLPAAPPRTAAPSGPVTLNFEGADLREVVRNILGDILHQSYEIDPNVGGTVTVRTSSGIPREALPSTLEMLLRSNGATMVRDGPVWKIVPAAAAVRGNVTPQLGNTSRALPQGYSVQIVPLHYVGAAEMAKILEPFAKDAQAVRPDIARNLLILSGTEQELRHLLETIDTFDIDWMKGMSAGIFVLHNADVKTVGQELDKVLGDPKNSPLAGVLRIIPIERMNALLVISPNQQYVDEAKTWIERLDSGSGEGVRFYVYNLQNQRAEHIAPLLQQAFTGKAAAPSAPSAPTLAPGTPAGTIVSPPAFQAQPTIAPNQPTPMPQERNAGGGGGSNVSEGGANAVAGRGGNAIRALAGEGGGTGVVRNVQVVADKDQNTLLIVATPAEYAVIEQALKKLDVPSRQVMIEVTIAQVKLNDNLQFGVDWLFKGGAPSGRGSGGNFNQNAGFNPAVTLPTSAAGAAASGLAAAAQGFSYIINNANFPGGVQAVLTLLDTYGNTKVIANPHIAALDNQKATIKAGFRIPVNQQTIVGNTTNAVTTTSQYIDTGVLLQVTPHINAGGLVTLDIQAEVSNPGNAPSGVAPPIDTQSIQTLLSVPSGQTMVMGGLIQDTKSNNTNGLPILNRVPVLGGLFGNQTLLDNRSELILFVTPRVVSSDADYDSVIEDLRRKMESLDRVFPGTPNWPASPPPADEKLNKLLQPQSWELPPKTPAPPTASPAGRGQPASNAPSEK